MNPIGKKIKDRRKELGLTQADVASGTVTRNMICAIENGNATPSLDTLISICEKLDLPIPYLFDEENDISFYDIQKKLPQIKRLYIEKKYKECENVISSLNKIDDEVAFLGAVCSFELGRISINLGNLKTADSYFNKAELYIGKTKYPTFEIRAQISIYRPIIKNIKAPLLELEDSDYLSYVKRELDWDFYQYLKQNPDYRYDNHWLNEYAKAKKLLKEKKFEEALAVLLKIEEMKNEDYRAPIILSIYTDIENCYHELCDFEKAYRYATKRLSLMESFNS